MQISFEEYTVVLDGLRQQLILQRKYNKELIDQLKISRELRDRDIKIFLAHRAAIIELLKNECRGKNKEELIQKISLL